MTWEEYLKHFRNIQEREQILSRQIHEHIRGSHSQVHGDSLKPLIERHQKIIDEYAELDRKYLSGS